MVMWEAYTRDPNWWRLQYLTALNIAVQCSTKENMRHPYEFAPWLETLAGAEERAMDERIAADRAAVLEEEKESKPPGAPAE